MKNRHHLLSLRGFWVGLVTLSLGIAAPAALANTLTSVQATSLDNGRVQVNLTLSDAAPKPRSFSIKNPARIAVDLPDTQPDLKHSQKAINIGSVHRVRIGAAGGRTRVVVDLNDSLPYTTNVSGHHILVTIGAKADNNKQSFGPVSEGEQHGSSKQPSKVTGSHVKSVDFRRGDDGAGRVLVHLSDPNTQSNISRRGGNVMVMLKNTHIAKKLVQRMDVRDFATPVDNIDVLRAKNNTKLIIHTHGQFKQLAYQSNDLLAIEVKPLTKQEIKAKKEKDKYHGKRLTLNFQNIQVRAVLQILADFSGLNMVVSDSVNGNITLRLNNVPWDQALNIILKTQGLAMRKKGNVIRIATAQEMAAHEKVRLQSQQQIQKLLPLHSTFIQVNYAKASSMASLIKSQGNSMLSDRGSVTVDARTNTLLVRDTEEHLQDIRRLVHRLDVPVRQVLISSRIVIVNKDFTHELGVKLGGSAVHPKNNGLVSVAGNAASAQNFANQYLSGAPNNRLTSANTPSVPGNLMVNAPTPDSSIGQLAVSILNSNYLVDLELSALQAEGNGKIISRPHVITSNQHKATIKQGVEIPYQQASSSGATNVQFKDAVLQLDVTPQITPDNNIIMDLDISKDAPGKTVPSATGGSIPSINTNQVTTQVLVHNGDTVVLGGIYGTKQKKSVHKVPLLGDIPLLGFLFRSKSLDKSKSELLIFVTPKILHPDTNVDASQL